MICLESDVSAAPDAFPVQTALRHIAKPVGKRLEHEVEVLPGDPVAFNAERNPVGPVPEKDTGNKSGSHKRRVCPIMTFYRPDDPGRAENESGQFEKKGRKVFKMRMVLHDIPIEPCGIPQDQQDRQQPFDGHTGFSIHGRNLFDG